MTEPLSFEEWKEKSHISTVGILENIAREHGQISDAVKDPLDEFLKKDYKLYLYQVKKPRLVRGSQGHKRRSSRYSR